jgi:Polyphosphate kinase 2 (PPK2)
VHNEILKGRKLPPELIGKHIWDERLSDIAQFEDYLTRLGTTVLKFFLHLSRKEQRKRLMDRLDKPEKHWKFSLADLHEREFWDRYMHAFEQAIRATASKHVVVRGACRQQMVHAARCRGGDCNDWRSSTSPILRSVRK